jgi:acylphosphatase
MKEIIQAKFTVRGYVQGVGYRYFAYRKADALGLTGFAKNEYDGSVTVVAEGEEQLIETFRQYLLQGPMRSHVESVTVERQAASGSYEGFIIR